MRILTREWYNYGDGIREEPDGRPGYPNIVGYPHAGT